MKIEINTGLATADAANLDLLVERADRMLMLEKIERTKRLTIEALLGLPSARADALDNVISSLLTSLHRREPFCEGHCRRVAYLSLVLARNLGLSLPEVRSILLAAVLHDVGKVSLPGEILRRPGPLDPAERLAIQAHPVAGEEFFRGMPYLEEARPLIRHHHERYDGRTTGEFPGYPYGLSGESIPLGARILKLADSVDAMLSLRPYKSARPMEEVMRIIKQEAGASFDPHLVEMLSAEDAMERMDSPQALAELYERVIKQAESAIVQKVLFENAS